MPLLNPQFFRKKFTVEDIDYFIIQGEVFSTVLPDGMLRVGSNNVLLIKLKEKEVEND